MQSTGSPAHVYAIPSARPPRRLARAVVQAVSQRQQRQQRQQHLSKTTTTPIRFSQELADSCRLGALNAWPLQSSATASGLSGLVIARPAASGADASVAIRQFAARLTSTVLDPLDLFFERRRCRLQGQGDRDQRRVCTAGLLDDLCKETLVVLLEQKGSCSPQDRSIDSAYMWRYALQTILGWHVAPSVKSFEPLISITPCEHAIEAATPRQWPTTPTVVLSFNADADAATSAGAGAGAASVGAGVGAGARGRHRMPLAPIVSFSSTTDEDEADDDDADEADLVESRLARLASGPTTVSVAVVPGVSAPMAIPAHRDWPLTTEATTFRPLATDPAPRNLDEDNDEWHMTLLSPGDEDVHPLEFQHMVLGDNDHRILARTLSLSSSGELGADADAAAASLSLSQSWTRLYVWNTDVTLNLSQGVAGMSRTFLESEIAQSPRAQQLIRSASLKLAALWLHYFSELAMAQSYSVQDRMIGGDLGAFVLPSSEHDETVDHKRQRQTYVLLEPHAGLLSASASASASASTGSLFGARYKTAYCRCCIERCLWQVAQLANSQPATVLSAKNNQGDREPSAIPILPGALVRELLSFLYV